MLIPKKEYKLFTDLLNCKKEKIENYAKDLRDIGEYKVFARRLAFDMLYYLLGSNLICEWYEKYGVNDSHLERFAYTCIKNSNLEVEGF